MLQDKLGTEEQQKVGEELFRKIFNFKVSVTNLRGLKHLLPVSFVFNVFAPVANAICSLPHQRTNNGQRKRSETESEDRC